MNNLLATIYKKIQINNNISLYKKVDIVTNASLIDNDEFNAITYIDKKGIKREAKKIENQFVLASDEKYVYSHLINIAEYQKIVRNDSVEKIVEIYNKTVSKTIKLSYYDEDNLRFKLITIDENELKNYEEENIFSTFIMNYDSYRKMQVHLEGSDIPKMISLLKRHKYELLEEKLTKLQKFAEEEEECYLNPKFQMITAKDISNKKEEEEDPIEQLRELVGLDEVKKEVARLVAFLKFIDKVEDEANIGKPNLHMFFSGNPGTGKTTVARIIAKVLHKLGYLTSDSFAEITPRELIAGYVGQTAIKTSEFIQKNKGGVIFIDEAYIFNSGSKKFANEAIVEILKELEKNETVFIFAGYKDEMDEFMKTNPGLTSRIGYYLDYKDYSKEQLLEIFETKINNMGLKVSSDLKEKVLLNIEKAKENEHFGNGRYIDKLIQKIILNHSVNTLNEDNLDALLELKGDDFTEENEKNLIHHKKKGKLGF